MKNIPTPLYNRIIATGLIGAGCVLFSFVYFIVVRDRILLFLSAIILLTCVWRIYEIYLIVKNENYEIIEGTCVGINSKIIGKFKTVHMLDDAGIETSMRLSKNCKLIIGERYKLYFDKRNQYRTGSSFFDTALATGRFLGYESLLKTEEQKEYMQENEEIQDDK